MRGICLVLLLAGCQVKTSGVAGGSSTGPTSSNASQSSASSASSGTSAPTGNPNDRIPIPDLTGKTPDEARAALRAAGFTADIEINRRPLECVGVTKRAGIIDCQAPEPGKLTYRGGIISVNVHEERGHAGRLIRDQLIKVHGMTVEEAKKYLKSIGHYGEVRVSVATSWYSKCGGVDKVCQVHPESGTSPDAVIGLEVNPGSKEDPNRVDE